MLEVEKLIQALQVYRTHLVERDQLAKAAVVGHCITIVQRVAKG